MNLPKVIKAVPRLLFPEKSSNSKWPQNAYGTLPVTQADACLQLTRMQMLSELAPETLELGFS
jgi:hypothetical protein